MTDCGPGTSIEPGNSAGERNNPLDREVNHKIREISKTPIVSSIRRNQGRE